MDELLIFFPSEIASRILQYTYMFQDRKLLHDIVNYTKTKETLVSLYTTYITIRNPVGRYNSWVPVWLSNDIAYYMNDFNNTGILYGSIYMDKFYSRLSRNPFLNTRKKIDKYVNELECKDFNSISQIINLYLGLLTIEERYELMEWVIGRVEGGTI